jgi:hypothetical protein
MHRPPRNTALVALVALALMLAASVLLERGPRSMSQAIGDFAPLLAIAALPLVYMAVRLRARPDRGALVVGVVYPTIVLVAFLLDVYRRCHGTPEEQADVVQSLAFSWRRASWATFLLFYVPALARLLGVSCRALGAMADASGERRSLRLSAGVASGLRGRFGPAVPPSGAARPSLARAVATPRARRRGSAAPVRRGA